MNKQEFPPAGTLCYSNDIPSIFDGEDFEPVGPCAFAKIMELEQRLGEAPDTEKGFSNVPMGFEQTLIFTPDHRNSPKELLDEVRQLWADMELGNDTSYLPWDASELTDDYPILAEYLKTNNVKNCLIHWWW